MKKKVTSKISGKKASIKNNVVLYQAKSGAIELKGDIKYETFWATQAQIAQVEQGVFWLVVFLDFMTQGSDSTNISTY